MEHSQHRENVIYRDQSRIVELLLQLENKQQIRQNNAETQHNRMYSLYIGSLCIVAFPMARFTCIVTSQVFVKIWMRWSIARSSAFYTGRKHLWIVFSFNWPWCSSVVQHLSSYARVPGFNSQSSHTFSLIWYMYFIVYSSIPLIPTTVLF